MTTEQMLEGTIIIYTSKHNFKNIKEAKIWAKKNIIGLYKNAIIGENIRISGKAIDKYLSESAIKKSVNQNAHLSALIKLPELLQSAILKDIHSDINQNKNIKEIQRLYGAIDYEKNIYPVKITVKVSQIEGGKAYSYEVMNIENPNDC